MYQFKPLKTKSSQVVLAMYLPMSAPILTSCLQGSAVQPNVLEIEF
jgi:hypothetical protein